MPLGNGEVVVNDSPEVTVTVVVAPVLIMPAAVVLAVICAVPPPEFVMIARVMGMISGTMDHYRPSIDWAGRVLPHLASALS